LAGTLTVSDISGDDGRGQGPAQSVLEVVRRKLASRLTLIAQLPYTEAKSRGRDSHSDDDDVEVQRTPATCRSWRLFDCIFLTHCTAMHCTVQTFLAYRDSVGC
jgi:hypothetical protein